MLTSILVALIMGASYVLRDVLVGRKTTTELQKLSSSLKEVREIVDCNTGHAVYAASYANKAHESASAVVGALHVYHEALKPALAQLPKTRKRKVAAGIGEAEREVEA